MAFCANCGHEMSEQAVACPNCGHPNELLARPVQTTRYAGFWIRFLGIIIDGIIVSLVSIPFGHGASFVHSANGQVTARYYTDYPGTIVWFLYTWLMLGLNDGRTLAGMMLGIRIAKPDGGKIGLGAAAGRQAMAIVSAAALGLGYLWAAWDPQKRTWHDMVVDTRAFRRP